MTAKNLPAQLEIYRKAYNARTSGWIECRRGDLVQRITQRRQVVLFKMVNASGWDEKFYFSAPEMFADLEASIALNRELVAALKIIASGGDGQFKWSMIKAEKRASEAITLAEQHGFLSSGDNTEEKSSGNEGR